MGPRLAAIALIIIGVLIYAGFSGRWVSTDQRWYQSLEQPWWQPPPWVFGLIWPYNFLALLVVGILFALSASPVRVSVFLIALAVTVLGALVWAYQFYVPHNLTIAALALSAAALVNIVILVIASQERWWWGAALLPYQIWLLLAASLAWGYAHLDGKLAT
jgi:benzodiazapine receptor